jgi:hypothetical protein
MKQSSLLKRNRIEIESDSEEDKLKSLLFGKNYDEVSGNDTISYSIARKKGGGTAKPWKDADDELLEVDLNKSDKLKKFQKQGKTKVTSNELHQYLQERLCFFIYIPVFKKIINFFQK